MQQDQMQDKTMSMNYGKANIMKSSKDSWWLFAGEQRRVDPRKWGAKTTTEEVRPANRMEKLT
jgi:hypothetical protein